MPQIESVMTIENWAIIFPNSACLTGDVSGNPRFEDATEITTSRLIKADPENEIVMTVSGSLYKLGNPAPTYEKMYPNSKRRLLESCPDKFSVNGLPQQEPHHV